LVEVMVALAMFAVIIIAVGAFESNTFRYNSEITGSFQTAESAQVILKTMIRELRGAEPSVTGSFPILNAGSTTISFFADSDNDGLPEEITYTLVGTDMKRAVIKPTGSPLGYDPATQATTTLLTHVINGAALPVFQYFDDSYTGTSSPLVQPVSPSSVHLIKVNQQIELDPNRSPLPIIYSVQVNLRNLKTNL